MATGWGRSTCLLPEVVIPPHLSFVALLNAWQTGLCLLLKVSDVEIAGNSERGMWWYNTWYRAGSRS